MDLKNLVLKIKKFLIGEPKQKSKKVIVKEHKIRKYIKSFFAKHTEKFIFIRNFIIYSIAYGVPINYALWGVFGIRFGIFSFPAYGVLWYILSEELPRIKFKFFPPRQ